VFDGLIMASGPSARFAIGICAQAQGDWKGPTTPTTRSVAAYAFAFDAHLRKSKFPVCAVESSHD
jgi:hypothetical protein